MRPSSERRHGKKSTDVFKVDELGPGDYDAKGHPYSGRCEVIATVASHSEVRVRLSDSPRGGPVDAWLRATGNAISEQLYSSMGTLSHLTFVVTPTTLQQVADLARAFEAIVRPGAPRYAVPSYKYACPSTARALDRLHRVLAGVWP